MTLPSFMKHVRVLESNGLIRPAKSGRVRTCELNRERFALVEDWLVGRVDRPGQPGAVVAARPTRRRVERLDVRPGGAFVTLMSDDGDTFVPHLDGLGFAEGWGTTTDQLARLVESATGRRSTTPTTRSPSG